MRSPRSNDRMNKSFSWSLPAFLPILRQQLQCAPRLFSFSSSTTSFDDTPLYFFALQLITLQRNSLQFRYISRQCLSTIVKPTFCRFRDTCDGIHQAHTACGCRQNTDKQIYEVYSDVSENLKPAPHTRCESLVYMRHHHCRMSLVQWTVFW